MGVINSHQKYRYIITNREYDKSGKIIGYALRNYDTNVLKYVESNKLKEFMRNNPNLEVINATLTSDNRIVLNENAINELEEKIIKERKAFEIKADTIVDEIMENVYGYELAHKFNLCVNSTSINSTDNIVSVRLAKGNSDYQFAYRVVSLNIDKQYWNNEFKAENYYLFDILMQPLKITCLGKDVPLNKLEKYMSLGQLVNGNVSLDKKVLDPDILTPIRENEDSFNRMYNGFIYREYVGKTSNKDDLYEIIGTLVTYYSYSVIQRFNKEIIKRAKVTDDSSIISKFLGVLADTTCDLMEINLHGLKHYSKWARAKQLAETMYGIPNDWK